MNSNIDAISLSIPSHNISLDFIYFLSDYPLLGIEEREGVWISYWNVEDWENVSSPILLKCEELELSPMVETIPTKNWNEVWESAFQEVEVSEFCRIRASFHSKDPKFEHEITIDPKMAFGTGHHATTFQMIEGMRNLNFEGQKVLDFGTGTGVLAILAHQLGASDVIAVDNDFSAYESTLENVELNSADPITALHGDLQTVSDHLGSTDIILANINRNVLLDVSKNLSSLCSSGALLVMSGIFESDFHQVQKAYESEWSLLKRSSKDQWLCLQWKKK
jgi:ribosomal protein L11 methyltransferase